MVERLTKKRFGDDVEIVGDLTLDKSPTSTSHATNKLYVDTEIAVIPEATNEPMGFESRTDSVISFNASTRTFSISPSSGSFIVWCSGKRFVKTSTETLQLPAASGLYYISYNSTAQLQQTTTVFDLKNVAPVSYVYYNHTDQVAYFFADERHGIVLDWQTHEYLHRTRGAAYASGLNVGAFTLVGNGSADSHMQFDLSNGTFFDEDIKVDILHSASPTANTWEQILQSGAEIPIFYQIGTSGVFEWKHTTPTKFPVKQGTLPQYNLFNSGTSSWTTPDITTNLYGLTWIVATNNLNYPVIGIMGQKEYQNLNKVAEDSWTSVDLTGLPIFELRPLYKLAYLVSSSFTNTPKAAIRQIIDIRRYDSFISGVPAVPVSDHGGLLGLTDDDHPQYVHISENRTITASHTFSNGLISNSNIVTSGLIVDSIEIDTTPASNGQALIFNGNKFIPTSIAGRLEVSNTAPTGASVGDLWFDSNSGLTFVYYDNFWVEIGGY
jgi:hypothetical protein